MFIITLVNNVFDVSKFINKHPGESICNIYLCEYNKKTVSNEFNKFHSADDAYEMLELAIKLKEYNFCKSLLFI